MTGHPLGALRRRSVYAVVLILLPALPLVQVVRAAHLGQHQANVARAGPTQLPATYVVSNSVDLSTTGGTVDVMCHSGDFATGGGFGIPTPGLNVVRASEPDVPGGGTPAGWHVAFLNSSGLGDGFVVCMSPATFGSATTTTRIVEFDRTFGAPDGNAGGATATCAGSDFATGGGFEAGGGKNVLRSRPDPASGTPNGWHAFFSISVDFGSVTVKAFAVCMTPVNLGSASSSTYVNVNSAPVGNNAGGVAVSCRTSDFATGGGFDLSPSSNKFTLQSEPNVSSGTPTGWANFYGIGGAITGTAYAVCVPIAVLPPWKAAFEAWKSAHCQVLPPQQVLNVAFIPVRFMGDTVTPLSLMNIAERLDYIKEFYYQQSMCSVQLNPTILSNSNDPAGRWTLPLSEAQYSALTLTVGSTTVAIGKIKYIHDALIWSNAFSLANPTASYDAIVTLHTASPTTILSNSMFNRGEISAVGATVATLLSLFLGPFGVTLDLLVASTVLTTQLFHQGSVIVADNDEIETWAHELGHGLFSVWDYYNDNTVASVRGFMSPWELMANPMYTTPAPIGIYNRVQAGWLRFNDVTSFGTYPLAFLGNLSYGSQTLRYRSESCVLFVCTPNGPVDHYIFELHSTPDDVPRTPPANDPAVKTEPSTVGLVIYEQREVRNVLGVPTRTPYCGGLHGLGLLAAAALVDHGFSDCVNRVQNVMAFPADPLNNMTIGPGQCYVDDVINVSFCLNTDMTNPMLTIHGSATSRNVISLEQDGAWTCTSCAPPNGHVTGFDPAAKLPRADLHVNGPGTEHVGPNYQSGTFDLSVPGSRVGGAYSPGQWISVPDTSNTTFVIDGTQAFANAALHGLANVTLTATIFVANYDASGNRSVIVQPTVYTLDQNHQTVGPLTITKLAVDAPVTSDYHDAATVSATLRNFDTNAGISGQSVTLTLNNAESCTATTDGAGKASCTITPGEPAGTYALAATFAGSPSLIAASASGQFQVTHEETTLTYTGAPALANGISGQLSAVLKEDSTTPIAGRAVTITLGTGATAQTCIPTPVTDATGTARCTLGQVNQSLGPTTVSVNFAGDGFYKPASDTKAVVIFIFLGGGGGNGTAFVVGDQNVTIGTQVTFWSANWSEANTVSGGRSPASFKGFADQLSVTQAACGGTWIAQPGNSSKPADSLPTYMAVIVTSTVSKSGSTISGNIVHIVIVKTDAGYMPNPGHIGTSTILAVLC